METSTTNRRLATILVADVDGYSRLMRADEEGTLVDPVSYTHLTLPTILLV